MRRGKEGRPFRTTRTPPEMLLRLKATVGACIDLIFNTQEFGEGFGMPSRLLQVLSLEGDL